MKTSNAMIGTVVAAAVGYAIADGLARACTYAEDVEDAEFCAAPAVRAPAVVPVPVVHPGPAGAGPASALPSPRTAG